MFNSFNQTSIWLAVSSFAIFILSPIVKHVALEPIFAIRKIREEFTQTIIYQANQLYSPMPRTDEAKLKLRELASRLRSSLNAAPGMVFWFAWLLMLLPTKKNLYIVSQELIGLSNIAGHPTPDDRVDTRIDLITKIFKIRPY